ncbi:MAG: amidohydrolase [Nocardioidaceae bacterium]
MLTPALEAELVEFRRDLHAHPELSWQEQRTTGLVAERLSEAGVRVQLLPRSGLIAELGTGERVVALRADLDALPVDDRTTDPWTSTVPAVAHACGHDVHTSAVLGAGLCLAERDSVEPLPGRVRLLFQPAEEMIPGGAPELIAAGALEDVGYAFALHCDPALDVGRVGLRSGAITGAADSVRVRVSGRGGHTSRPQLTEDLTYALAKLVTDLPAALSRRLDPRSGASIVFGMIRAGSAPNVIPDVGEVAGTVRMLDPIAWAEAATLVPGLIEQLLAPYGVESRIDYIRGVPPVVNDEAATGLLGAAIEDALGPAATTGTLQSLGGEDFAWYLNEVPGAMGRLGTRSPGGPTYDLHQGDLRIDEGAVAVGARVLAATALRALS